MADLGFSWEIRKNGDVVILHRGKRATTLRGGKASDFLDLAESGDGDAVQQELARLTGNYKRGNERHAKGHPRNA
ncbi:hypothetical protein [Hasllibacter sp. MH4015]|uniref:hypothetical protein n=1 Tax=Hasllibacter sp. MH4015 TaxID=2854029 RepID=UPI001CD55DFA|nr:hypothetical protein [Hasllibacter sp. MH4015]